MGPKALAARIRGLLPADDGGPIVGFLLAVAAHTGFGLYVVLLKYLSPTIPMSLALAAGNGVTTLVACCLAWRDLRWRDLAQSTVWLLCFVVVVRSVSKLWAVQYTLATYVQLVDMIVPFLTPVAAWLLMRETVPPRTIPALIATSFGSLLVITVDPFNMLLPTGHSDLIGIAIALGSATSMALLVAQLRHMSTARFSPARVLVYQSLALMIVYAVLGVAGGERLSSFAGLSPGTWVTLVLFVLFALTGAGICQVWAVSRTRSSLYSSLLSWRLVVAVAMGWLLLGERIRSWWQVAGILIVVVSLSSYLHHQAILYRRDLAGKGQ